MEEVTYGGLTFEPYITREKIMEQVKRLAREIERDCEREGEQSPLFLCVLTGAFMFGTDLFRECNIHDAEIAFIRFKSYEGTSSSGVINEVMGLSEDVEGRYVIIVEDIVDTGVTADQLRAMLAKKNPKKVKMVSLLFKPESITVGERPEYVGFEIPSKFILGYGLDLDGKARNLNDIYVLKKD
ncbi:MAG: hypoxanthine phosphoribosyltransferase [Muribaculaceae bacterium]|nr:hypoxanthine phosphoribosyltransferase [Muribaculaceae bacterium]